MTDQPRADVDTFQMWDAAYCPDPIPGAVPACMVYIGGSSAARVWEPGELARVEHLPRLPVWVPTPGVDDPRRAAADCLARLRELGVPSFSECGYHPRVLWDCETGREPDAGWLYVVRSRMHAAGYYTVPYGSTSWLFGYPVCAGYFVAAPGAARLFDHPYVVGTQYAYSVPTPGGVVDLSLITSELLGGLWAPTVKPALPTPA